MELCRFADLPQQLWVTVRSNRNPSCLQGNPKTLLRMSINLRILRLFTHISRLKAQENMPVALLSPQHPVASGVPPLHSQHTVCEKWMPQWSYFGRVLHVVSLWTLHICKKHVYRSLQHVNEVHFTKNVEHFHSLSPRPRLQCLSVQWPLLSVGPLGLACRCVSLQHRYHPLPPLYRPRQPLFPTPHSYATGGTGAQWHRAPRSAGKAIQCLNKCWSIGWVKWYSCCSKADSQIMVVSRILIDFIDRKTSAYSMDYGIIFLHARSYSTKVFWIYHKS